MSVEMSSINSFLEKMNFGMPNVATTVAPISVIDRTHSGPSGGSYHHHHHHRGGGHGHNSNGNSSNKKHSIALTALTLLAFLFFLNILQNCLDDNMDYKNQQTVMMIQTNDPMQTRDAEVRQVESRKGEEDVSYTNSTPQKKETEKSIPVKKIKSSQDVEQVPVKLKTIERYNYHRYP